MDLPEARNSGPLSPPKPAALRARVPMAAVAALLIGGIALGLKTPPLPALWLIAGTLAGLAGLGTLAVRRWQLMTQIAAALAIALLAGGYAQFRYHTVRANDITLVSGPGTVLATVTGQIVSPPQTTEAGGSFPGYRPDARTTFLLRARTLHTDHGDMPISGLVNVVIDRQSLLPQAGQTVRLPGRLTRLGSPSNPGQFDWSEYQRRRGIRMRLTVPAFEHEMILTSQSSTWLSRKVWQLRISAVASLGGTDDHYQGDLVRAMVLGQRSPALHQLQRAMVDAGVAHFLSISGLHLGMALAFIYGLCRLMNLSPRWAAITVLVLLGSYLLVAQWRVPLIRAALMAAALCAAVLAGRKVSPLNSLSLAAVIILLVDPVQVLSAGFQLSFVIVAAVLVGTEPLKQAIFGRFLKTRGLLVFRQGQWFRRWLYFRLADGAMVAIAMALAAYIAAAPLVAYHFGLLTPYAPLLGILLTPLVALIVVFGYASLAVSAGLPGLGGLLGHVAGAAAGWMAAFVKWTAILPGRTIPLRPLGAVWLACTYGVIVLTCLARRFRGGTVVVTVAVVIWAGGTLCLQRQAAPPNNAELSLLAVGNGQCGVLRVPSGDVFLIDAGTQSGFDVAGQTLMPFLRTRRWPTPTAAFISHANTDHYNALPTLVKSLGLQRVYVNETFGIDTNHAGGPDAATTLAQLEGLGVEIIRLHAGQAIDLDRHTRVEVLWPDSPLDKDLSINDRSLVLRVTCDQSSVLLPGDVQTPARQALLAAEAPSADVLVLPHHGAWQSDLPAFIAATEARLLLQSVGRHRSMVGADDGEMAFFTELREAGQLYSTREDGWIQLHFGRDGVRVNTATSQGED